MRTGRLKTRAKRLSDQVEMGQEGQRGEVEPSSVKGILHLLSQRRNKGRLENCR